MRRRHGPDLKEGADSITDSSIDDSSKNSSIDSYSSRNSSTGSELSELAIHTLLVVTRARDLDREGYQDPDSDRYLIPSERVFDNAADELETIAVSKRSISLLPQKEVVRTDVQPFKQETQPLAKIWCVKMEEDSHQPNEMNCEMRFMKTYLKARYILSNLLRAQRNDRMTSEKVDRIWRTRQRRPGRRQLPYPETILHAEGGEIIFEQGRGCGLHEKRRRQSSIQV